ncbi:MULTISPECIES: IPT/TIG domain-containing protein [unclassified Kitasatospora]|uniref:IPT/TIG domain-containing protein n=1 Tax=unclassified Kitasatospora TaxID=2633591 RepID=UPI0033C01BB0
MALTTDHTAVRPGRLRRLRRGAGAALATAVLGTAAAVLPAVPAHASAPASLLYIPSGYADVLGVDPATGATVSTLPSGGASPYAAVTPDGSQVWTGSSTYTLSVVDTATNTVAGTIGLGTYHSPTAIAFSPDGAHAYVDYYEGGVGVIDTATRTVTAIVPTGSQAAQIAVSPDGRQVYVPSPAGSSVTVIDTATNTVAATISVPGAFGAAFSPDGTRAYVSNSRDRALVVIDTATATVSSTVTVGWLPQGVAVSPDGGQVYVGSALGTTSVVDATTNTMLTSIPTGGWSTAVLASPDGSHVYVSSLTNGTVSIIDTATLTITSTIPTDQNVYQLAMAPLPPTATGLTPTTGPAAGGTTVTLTGSHLYGTTAVAFGTTPASSFTVVNDTTVTAVAPPHAAGPVDVKLTAKGRTVTAGTYTYQVPAPTITGIAPAQGPAAGGTTVTLTGSHLTGTTAVAFGTTPAASFTVVNDTTVTATAPAASGSASVDVTVTTPGGTSTITAADRYTYTKDTTKLTANPLLLSIAPGQLSINLNLSATLTDTTTGKPVPGATVTFKVGSTTVCTATTDAAGTATCTGPCPVVTVLLNLGYTATYNGSPTQEAATATAGLIRIT